MGKGSSGIKSGGETTPLSRSLKSVEDRIKGNDTETAIILDEDGNVLVDTSDGNAHKVSLSPEQMSKAYGKIITHNHPNGIMFSDGDLRMLEVLYLKQLRATTPDGRVFVLERKWDMPNTTVFRREFMDERKRTAQKAADLAYEPSLTNEEFNSRAKFEHTKIMNKWLTENATKYGYEFREERTK